MKLDKRTHGILLAVLTFTALALSYHASTRGVATTPTGSARLPDQDLTTPPHITLRVGDPAPNLPLMVKNGTLQRPFDYRGQRVVLVFFRDNPECVSFVRRLEKQRRRAPEVVVLGVSTNGPGEIDGFRSKTKVTFPLCFDRDYDHDRLDQQIQCPYSVSIDENGIISSITDATRALAND